MIRAVVIGQSHTVCMSQAAIAHPASAEGVAIYRFRGKQAVPGDESVSIEEAAKLIRNLPVPVPVFLSVIGGIHNILGLVRHERDFDFVFQSNTTSADLDVPDIIPLRAVADTFDFYIEQATKFLLLKESARAPVFLIGTPPPKSRNAFILEKFAKGKKQEYRGRNVVEIGVNTPRLRKKFWLLECDRSRLWAERHGIEYLAAPQEAFDDNGFLRECFYEDATHANKEYGALVLTQISDVLRSSAEASTHG